MVVHDASWQSTTPSPDEYKNVLKRARDKKMPGYLTRGDVEEKIPNRQALSAWWDLYRKTPYPEKGITMDSEVRNKIQAWRNLDPRDQSTVLREQGLIITGDSIMRDNVIVWPNLTFCDQSLLDLRDYLKSQIPDELDAHKNYTEAANKMTSKGLPIFASALHSMANEELSHKTILEIIVDVITEKCGPFEPVTGEDPRD